MLPSPEQTHARDEQVRERIPRIPARSPSALAVTRILRRLSLGLPLLAVSIFLGGCKVGPDFAAPHSYAPDSFSHVGDEGFGGPSAIAVAKSVDAQWWRLLGDPALEQLIQRAVAGNLDVKLASARVYEARSQRAVIAADAYPRVDLDANASRSRQSKNTAQSSFVGGRNVNLFQAGFDANWELDFFGRVSRNVEAADADIQSIEEDRRDVLVTLVSEVARNYIELRGAQQRLDIAHRNIQTQQDTLDIASSRHRAGLTSDLDVAQAESSLSNVRATVPPLDRSAQAAIHRLGVLLGKPPGALAEELAASSSVPGLPPEVPVGLPSELLRRRPDIRRAERELAAATARIGVASAELYPRFSLTGSFGFAAEKVPSLPDASSRFWSFGPAMKWPVLDWQRIRSNIRVQEARTEESLLRYEQAVLRAFEDTENALTGYTREQARRRLLADSVASNQRAFNLANDLYKSGITDFQRVLDSQRSLFNSQDALSDSDRAVASNLVALYKALGGGWESFAPLPRPG